MREVVEGNRDVKQKSDKKEEQYLKRLNEARFRCGNFHSEYKKITPYVVGLSPNVKMEVSHQVSHHCETTHRLDLTFESARYFANSQY